jgi:hypothetical protein
MATHVSFRCKLYCITFVNTVTIVLPTGFIKDIVRKTASGPVIDRYKNALKLQNENLTSHILSCDFHIGSFHCSTVIYYSPLGMPGNHHFAECARHKLHRQDHKISIAAT